MRTARVTRRRGMREREWTLTCGRHRDGELPLNPRRNFWGEEKGSATASPAAQRVGGSGVNFPPRKEQAGDQVEAKWSGLGNV